MFAIPEAKKLALVLAIFMSMTIANMKAVPIVGPSLEAFGSDNSSLSFKRMSYIHHEVQFKKDHAKIQALLNFGNEIIAMTLVYAASLGIMIQSTNVGAQNINGSTFETFEMILASFRSKISLEKSDFFKRSFYWPTLVLTSF